MTLYLIRHGKTLANEQHCYCGSTDLPLSPLGREELAALHYPDWKARYLTSGMARANETMEALFPGTPYEIDPRFREVDFGIFEGKTYVELKDTPAYQIWLTGDNEANIPPQGESGKQMHQRVLAALADIHEDTVLVCHGGVIAAIMAHFFPEAGKNRYQWQPKNGHGYAVTEKGYRAIP